MNSSAPSLQILPSPESFQISDCVSETAIVSLSAIDEFEIGLLALNKTASLLPASGQQDVVAQMLIVSAVSATETYFKRVLASLAAVCPLTAENVGSAQIAYRAIRIYPQEVTALALLEGVLFSSRGVIASELKKFTKYDVKNDEQLSGGIAAFDEVCLVRHSAAHWRGFLDSRSVSTLGLNTLGERIYRLDLSFDLVQRAFAVCDYLVRLTNERLYRHTLRKWLDRGLIVLDEGTLDNDVEQCRRIIRVFASEAHCAQLSVTAEDLREILFSDSQQADA